MFDQEQAIAAWRARLARTGNLFESDLDELESHLRDRLEEQEASDDAARAFELAVEALGDVGAIGDEFAKVNRLAAWRAPLFWMAVGVLAIVGGAPIHRMLVSLTLFGGVALHLPPPVVRASIWLVTLGLPLAALAMLFMWSRRDERPTFAWADSPVARVAALVGCGVVVLATAVTQSLFAWGSWRPAHSQLLDAVGGAQFNATHVLGIGMPIAIAAFALGVRAGLIARVRDDGRVAVAGGTGGGAPIWLALGVLLVFGGEQVDHFVRLASYTGGAARFGFAEIRVVTWALTLLTPALLLGGAWTWLRHRAPQPASFVVGRGSAAVIAALCASPIIFTSGIDHFSGSAWRALGISVFVHGNSTWVQASYIATALLTIASGALALRMRSAIARVQ